MSVDDIEALIEQLGDPSFESRQSAVERLYATGPDALERLRAVTRGRDAEVALRAQRLIERIGQLYLVGAQVRLSLDRPAAKWDEPVALRVEIINDRTFPIHLPFLTSQRKALDTDRKALQVGAALDTADFLEIIGPDGKVVEVRVDDYRGFDSIEAAIDGRVHLEPSSDLLPGQRFELTVPEFNRGPARWRLLTAGAYRIRFVYVPEWDEPMLVQSGVGRIASNEVVLHIAQGAPQNVGRTSRLLFAAVRRDGPDCVATLRSTHDRPLTLNLNIGPRGNPLFAQVRWRLQRTDNETTTDPLDLGVKPAPKRIVRVQPGASVELARMPLARLQALAPGSGPLSVAVRYTSFVNRSSLDADAETAPFRAALGMPTFVGILNSELLDIAPD